MPTAAGLYYFAYNEDLRSRPPLILIHGAGGSHLQWPPEVRRLLDQRIYAIDLPGHGKSDGLGRQSVEDYAEVIVEFMQAIKLSRAIFVGLSMGSAIALTLALTKPRRTLGLGMVGGGVRLRVAPEILINAANPATFLLAVQTIHEWCFSPNVDQRLKELSAQRMAETRPTVLYGDFLACDIFDVSDQVSKVRTPTLVLCGTEDRMTPPRYSEYMAGRIKNARIHLVDEAGHMVTLEKPSAVAGALLDFVRSINYQPGE
jgi:pimeloyl-ACP methyl ester carboxylesterase